MDYLLVAACIATFRLHIGNVQVGIDELLDKLDDTGVESVNSFVGYKKRILDPQSR